MKTFRELKKNLKKDFQGFKKVKFAILGDSATQFLNNAIRGYSHENSIDLDIFEADYNQVEQQIMNPMSGLYDAKPEVVLIFQSTHKLVNRFYKEELDSRENFAQKESDNIDLLYSNLKNNLPKAKVILCNYYELNDSVFGNFSNKLKSSFVYQTRKLNLSIMDKASEYGDLFVCDINSVMSQIGVNNFTDNKIYVNTDMVLSIDALPIVAKNITDIVASISGKFKKCLILDLDNTTWGGIIGDDGIENIEVGDLGIGKAFTNLQKWAKELKNRGIILAICSKNTEHIAKEPFEKHPEMILKLDDISMFVANWENKADNIRHIQKVLNIGFDSMVFLDDNPFERNIVRQNIPQVLVPELPVDPADYVPYLRGLNLFETTSFSGNDSDRTKQYQVEAKRQQESMSFTNQDDFLKSMEMTSEVKAFDKFTIPRISQLSQRSNQFNFRTIRYSEDDIIKISESDNYIDFSFTLRDKYGDNGLISVVILEKQDKNLFINTWIMSCRVLKRGMEDFVINKIVSFAKAGSFENIIGQYIPTPKNVLVKDVYKDKGFEDLGDGKWKLSVDNYENKKCFIKEIK